MRGLPCPGSVVSAWFLAGARGASANRPSFTPIHKLGPYAPRLRRRLRVQAKRCRRQSLYTALGFIATSHRRRWFFSGGNVRHNAGAGNSGLDQPRRGAVVSFLPLVGAHPSMSRHHLIPTRLAKSRCDVARSVVHRERSQSDRSRGRGQKQGLGHCGEALRRHSTTCEKRAAAGPARRGGDSGGGGRAARAAGIGRSQRCTTPGQHRAGQGECAAPDLPMYKATMDRNQAMAQQGIVSRQAFDDTNRDYIWLHSPRRDSAKSANRRGPGQTEAGAARRWRKAKPA